MSKIDDYRQTLKKLDDWIPFLRKESGLPGPRGNLELAYAVAEEGNEKQFKQFLSFQAEENTPEVFLVFCGVVGLGNLAANDPTLFDRLREYAADPRWRIREAVAKQPKHAKEVLKFLDDITVSMENADGSKDERFKVLRQGMGYCWSVAVAALPEIGKPMMEKWLDSQDKNICWMMKENLKKNRLVKMDADWVQACIKRLEVTS